MDTEIKDIYALLRLHFMRMHPVNPCAPGSNCRAVLLGSLLPCRGLLGFIRLYDPLSLTAWTFLKILLVHFLRQEGKGGRKTLIHCLSHAANWGPGLQHKHVPWLGTEPATFQFTGWCSIHWATPARALPEFLTCMVSWMFF